MIKYEAVETQDEFYFYHKGINEHKEYDLLSYTIVAEQNMLSIYKITKDFSHVLPTRFEFESSLQPEVLKLVKTELPDIQISTGHDKNAVVYKKENLDVPNKFYNQEEYDRRLNNAKKRCEELRRPPFIDKVYKILMDALIKKKNVVTVVDLAKELNKSPRTLSRDLAELNSSYNQIKNKVRKDLIIELLSKNTFDQAKQYAEAIKMDGPVLSTWFKKEFGKTFTKYIKNKKGQ